MDDDLARLFEAHVRYEVGRWQGESLQDTIAEAIDAGFDWLEAVTLRTLVPVDVSQDWVRHAVVDLPVSDELVEEVRWGIHTAHQALLEETGPLADVLSREHFDQGATSAVGLRKMRREIIGQITQSTVYAELISHVLYHGLKNYLVTENAMVRRIPGASSLVRMGQNAVRSATPNLEAGIDRRLLAFVASNVAETVKDSQAFLDATLDDAMLRTVAGEVWTTNAPRAVGEAAALVEEDSVDGVVNTARDAWLAGRSSALVTRLIDAVVEEFYEVHGDDSVAAILADLGITPETTMRVLGPVGAQLAEVAAKSEHLEAYVRLRLEPFYAGYADGSLS
jgi:hypothetical protein